MFKMNIDYNKAKDEVVTRHVTHTVVQHTENEFYIYFYEVRPPILLGSNDKIKTTLEDIKYPPTECVARVVMQPNKIKELIRLLQENFNKYQENI